MELLSCEIRIRDKELIAWVTYFLCYQLLVTSTDFTSLTYLICVNAQIACFQVFKKPLVITPMNSSIHRELFSTDAKSE